MVAECHACCKQKPPLDFHNSDALHLGGVIMAFVAINNLWNAKELAKTVFPELEVGSASYAAVVHVWFMVGAMCFGLSVQMIMLAMEWEPSLAALPFFLAFWVPLIVQTYTGQSFIGAPGYLAATENAAPGITIILVLVFNILNNWSYFRLTLGDMIALTIFMAVGVVVPFLARELYLSEPWDYDPLSESPVEGVSPFRHTLSRARRSLVPA
jgi:hypothetical protein